MGRGPRGFDHSARCTIRLIAYLAPLLARDPFATPPRFEKLVGDLAGAYSRRITIHHRLVYQILAGVRTVKILRIATRFE